MLVTLSPRVMLVRLVHWSNARSPMLVTPSGMVMLVRLVQPENAEAPMLVTLPSVGMILFLHPAINVPVEASIKQLLMTGYDVLFEQMLSRPLQPDNTEAPIDVTLSGMVMLVRLVQW